MPWGPPFDNTDRGRVVRRLIDELAARPAEVRQCIHVHRDAPAEKLAEGWAEGPGFWFSFDGGWISGDRGRGYLYPRFWQRRCLRTAIRRWMIATGVQWRGEPR